MNCSCILDTLAIHGGRSMNCSCILDTLAIHGGRTRRLSSHGWVHGVSSSEVRRSATRPKEHYGVELFMQTFLNRAYSLVSKLLRSRCQAFHLPLFAGLKGELETVVEAMLAALPELYLQRSHTIAPPELR